MGGGGEGRGRWNGPEVRPNEQEEGEGGEARRRRERLERQISRPGGVTLVSCCVFLPAARAAARENSSKSSVCKM